MQREIDIILNAIQPDSDMLNVYQVLGYQSAQFQDAFNIALAMENQNLVKLLYSNYEAGKIMVEFTRLGKAAKPKK